MHAGNGDMTDLGRRFVVCFDQAADDAGLPDDPDFRRALHDYMEWAVADVLTYSPSMPRSRRPSPCRIGHGTASSPDPAVGTPGRGWHWQMILVGYCCFGAGVWQISLW